MLYCNMVNSLALVQQLNLDNTNEIRGKTTFEQIIWKITATQMLAISVFISCEIGVTFGCGLYQSAIIIGTLPVVYSLWLLVKVTLDSLNLFLAYNQIWINMGNQFVTLMLGAVTMFQEVRVEDGLLVPPLYNTFSNHQIRLFAWPLILLAQLYLIMTSFFILTFYCHVKTLALPELKKAPKTKFCNLPPGVIVIRAKKTKAQLVMA